MKIKTNNEDYILIIKEIGDNEEDFLKAFNVGEVTLCKGVNSKNIIGIKIWKNTKFMKGNNVNKKT